MITKKGGMSSVNERFDDYKKGGYISNLQKEDYIIYREQIIIITIVYYF